MDMMGGFAAAILLAKPDDMIKDEDLFRARCLADNGFYFVVISAFNVFLIVKTAGLCRRVDELESLFVYFKCFAIGAAVKNRRLHKGICLIIALRGVAAGINNFRCDRCIGFYIIKLCSDIARKLHVGLEGF